MAQCVLGESLFSSDTAGKHVLWTWELVTDGKSSIFLMWNLDSCFIKPSRKTPRFIFLFIITTLVKYLSFLKETACLPLLSEKTSESTVSPNQDKNIYGSQYSQNILPWYFSHWMVQCALGVFVFSSKAVGKCVFVNWVLGPDVKNRIFPLGKPDRCNLKPARKAHWFIYLFLTTTLVTYLNFVKETGCLPLLAWKSSDSTVLPTQGNNRYGSKHSQNILSWYLFSWNGTVCPRSVFTQLRDCRDTWFVNLTIGAWWQKQYFSPVKTGKIQPQTCQKNTLIHFSLY